MLAYMLILGVVALAALAFSAFAVLQMRLSAASSAASLAGVAERATQALAQVKGLTPHQAAPKEFSPDGRSWDAAERGAARVTNRIRDVVRDHQKREFEDALRVFTAQGNAAKIAEMNEKLARLAEGA